MKLLSVFLLAFISQTTFAQVLLNADGPGDTYELITSVLAPGHNPIEVPDCSHNSFGEHIEEVFDADLDRFVFRFLIHTTPDNDRCINFDRQRNEIKGYDKSPDNLLGVENEKVVYQWKFKLPAGFQSSPNFTHLHQLKSVGGSLASTPIYTLTTRKSNPDRLELRYAETDNQITLTQTPLAPFIDTWLSVTEVIAYGESGTYEILIKRESDNMVLLSYSNSDIVNWRPNAEFVRPKWGIYRSLNNDQDLRDEAVLFADFSIEEVELTSTEDSETMDEISVYPNPVSHQIMIKNLDGKVDQIELFSVDGRKIMEESVDVRTAINLDVSSLQNGTYILHLKGQQINHIEKIMLRRN